jgi:iron complex outermembrane receptor protein
VLNLANRQPPFSDRSNYFRSTCAPTYTDPRGRTAFVSLSLTFR